jgi:hypothetical protein
MRVGMGGSDFLPGGGFALPGLLRHVGPVSAAPPGNSFLPKFNNL